MCAVGTQQCGNGMLMCEQTTQPTPEVCTDQLDNDCNGVVNNGCAPACARNVSTRVIVTRGGFRRHSATGRYVQQVTLKNNTATPIRHLALVLDSLRNNATLVNKTANTSCASPVSPYKTINLGELAADEEAGPCSLSAIRC